MPARKFKYLPHTADIAFVSYGRTFEEAVENAALAILNIRFDLKRLSKDNGRSANIAIKEHAKTMDNVAWYALQSVLSKTDAKSLMAYAFKPGKLSAKKNGDLELTGKLLYKKTPMDYSLMDVKAVTPHDFEVKHAKDWRIRVVIDI